MSKEFHLHGDLEPSSEQHAELTTNSSTDNSGEPCDPSPADVNTEFSSLTVSSEPSESTSIVQGTGIPDIAVRDSLVRIINKLNPASFVKLARTCRSMYDICFNTKGVEVMFGCSSDDIDRVPNDDYIFLRVTAEDDEFKPGGIRFVAKADHYDSFYRPFTFPEELHDIPMCFVIGRVNFMEEVHARHLEAFRQFLLSFRRIRVLCVELFRGTSVWKEFTELIQEFRVEGLAVGSFQPLISEDLLLLLATNLTLFYCTLHVSDEVVLAATTKHLTLFEARISVDTFKKLLEKFSTGHISCWFLGREHPISYENVYLDHFRRACSEVMKVAQVENPDFIIKDPGVLYWSPQNAMMFHLLRVDGSKGTLTIRPDYVVFKSL